MSILTIWLHKDTWPGGMLTWNNNEVSIYDNGQVATQIKNKRNYQLMLINIHLNNDRVCIRFISGYRVKTCYDLWSNGTYLKRKSL